jgi:hypothetical protein
MTKKDKQLIEDAEKNGTPIFVLSAKDKFSVMVLYEYLSLCKISVCSPEHVGGVQDRIIEFNEWQNSNNKKVKRPD